jgi:hypothetical protein
MTRPVNEWWVVEWAKGNAFEWHPVAEVVQRNGEMMLAEKMPERTMVGLVPTPEDAQCFAREMKRMVGCKGREAPPNPLLAAYDRFKHLDRVFEMVGDPDGTESTDPFHAAARDLWRAIKASLGIPAAVEARRNAVVSDGLLADESKGEKT